MKSVRRDGQECLDEAVKPALPKPSRRPPIGTDERLPEWNFKRGKVGQDEVSGGAIIKWLIKSVPKDFQDAGKLSEVIHRHSKTWITGVVEYRDTVSHYSEIKGFRHLYVPLVPNSPCFREELVREPTRPEGTPLRQYGAYLQAHVQNILQETLPLLPNVNLNEISFEKLFVR